MSHQIEKEFVLCVMDLLFPMPYQPFFKVAGATRIKTAISAFEDINVPHDSLG